LRQELDHHDNDHYDHHDNDDDPEANDGVARFQGL
jgi:hypothetical protein